jgi:hypothetical protein
LPIVLFVNSCSATKKTTESITERNEFNYLLATEIKGVPVSKAEIKVNIDDLKKLIPGASISETNGQATAKIEIRGDTVYVTAKCDSLLREIERLEAYVSDTKIQSVQETKETKNQISTPFNMFLTGVLTGIILSLLVKIFILK